MRNDKLISDIYTTEKKTDNMRQGMDVADIEIVIQFKATCNLCMLWQHFGQAARGTNWEGTVILLYEKKDIHYQENGEGTGKAGGKCTAAKQLMAEAPLDKHSRAVDNPAASSSDSIHVHARGGEMGVLTGEAAAVGGQIMVRSEGQKKARGKAARKGSLSVVAKTAEPAVGKAALATIQERKAAYLKADCAAMNLKTWKPPPTKPKSLKGRVHAIGDDDQ